MIANFFYYKIFILPTTASTSIKIQNSSFIINKIYKQVFCFVDFDDVTLNELF